MPRPILDPVGPYGRHPLQPHQLLDRMTATSDVIVLCHLGIPRLAPEDWSLSIDGMVRQPLHLTFNALKQRPCVEITAFHQCCGSPMKPDEPTRRICNVAWAGARLADLLSECGVHSDARFVWSSGADHGAFGDIICDAFIKDLPLERVGRDVLIAYEMNGEPLRPENGYPARLVVPGFYGTNSVKWLTRITLADRRADSLFTTRLYNDRIRDAAGEPTGKTKPVWSVAPESVIVSPAPDRRISARENVRVWGWAWADGGATDLELSVDDGAAWKPASLEPPAGHEWQRFTAWWRPEHGGAYTLCSRAFSSAGSQPATGARNAIHHVPVSVV